MSPGDPAARDAGRVFDDWAAQGKAEGMEREHGRTVRPVLASLALRGARLLDLGCGNGWVARATMAEGARAVGVDASPAMLARARAAGTPVARSTLEALPFRDASFDLVVSVEAIYYAGSFDAALAEARRVLAPGGALHLVIDYYQENTDSHGWPGVTGLAMHLLPEARWARALLDAGFHEVRTRRVRAEGGEPWKAVHGSLHVTGRA